ncbi:MAG: S8 family serine peptidase [Candidatus Heimdallarchaeota archaeon]
MKIRKKTIIAISLLNIVLAVTPLTLGKSLFTPPGSITIYAPQTNEEIYWLDYITIHFKVKTNGQNVFKLSKVFIDNQFIKNYNSEEVSDSLVNSYYVGKHILKIQAYFISWATPIEMTRTIYIKSEIDHQDFHDLRIDKLQNLGLGGQGITICIIDKNLGTNAYYNGILSEVYNPQIFMERGDKYRQIIYYDMSWEDDDKILNGFGKSNIAKKDIWEAIADDNSLESNSYDTVIDLHGTCVLSVLTQIAPHARFVFIKAEPNTGPHGYAAALQWLVENNRFITFGIDILVMSWGIDTDIANIRTSLTTMANCGSNPVIPVAAVGNGNYNSVDFPAAYNNVIGVGGVQDSEFYGYSESFDYKGEQDHFTSSNIWNYAHTDNFKINGERYIHDGFNSLSLKALANKGDSSARTYDGVQFWDELQDGSIEAWFYGAHSQYQVGALWLRTGEIKNNQNPTFSRGYMARLYNDELSIFKWDGTSLQKLTSKPLNVLWHNKWWHLKFEIVGDTLQAWATSDSYHTEVCAVDSDQTLSTGKAGFSARTNLAPDRYLYIDSLKIKDYKSYKNWQRYTQWLPNDQGGSNYGRGLHVYAIGESTNLGWNPFYPKETDNEFEFSGTSNACPIVAGIIALLKQQWPNLNVDDFLQRNEEGIILNTGDPLGYSPGDCNAPNEGAEMIHSAYIGVDPVVDQTETGWGIIDAYEMYLFLLENY